MHLIRYNEELINEIYQDNPAQHLDNIADFLRWTYSIFNRSDIFYGHGYDNAWDETEQLVLSGLHLPIDFPKEFYQSKLTSSEKMHIIEWVVKRVGQRIPVAYLTNNAWFCGLPFYVDERVIVPRSPISSLILARFSGLLKKEPTRILDMCTGSGCIAIACATTFPEAEVDAVDLSPDALNVTEINIDRHNLWHRVFPIQSDLFSQLPTDGYDLIVTNPPYVDQEDLDSMPTEFSYEPEMALGSGIDGLEITKKILAQAADYLSDEGILICEVGNSMVHLIEQYPQVPFNWVELPNGGVGVFALTKDQLNSCKEIFSE